MSEQDPAKHGEVVFSHKEIEIDYDKEYQRIRGAFSQEVSEFRMIRGADQTTAVVDYLRHRDHDVWSVRFRSDSPDEMVMSIRTTGELKATGINDTPVFTYTDEISKKTHDLSPTAEGCNLLGQALHNLARINVEREMIKKEKAGE